MLLQTISHNSNYSLQSTFSFSVLRNVDKISQNICSYIHTPFEITRCGFGLSKPWVILACTANEMRIQTNGETIYIYIYINKTIVHSIHRRFAVNSHSISRKLDRSSCIQNICCHIRWPWLEICDETEERIKEMDCVICFKKTILY